MHMCSRFIGVAVLLLEGLRSGIAIYSRTRVFFQSSRERISVEISSECILIHWKNSLLAQLNIEA